MDPTTLTICQHDMFVDDGKSMFKTWYLGQLYKIDRDLGKNKKKILEALATKILYPKNDKIKTFRQTKAQLVDMIVPHITYKEKENPDSWDMKSDGSYFTLPAGTYYIGDLCYALDGDVYDNIWGKKHHYNDGLYVRNTDQAYFGMHRTESGDGVFKDENGKEFYVDAGHIGIASASLCTKSGNEDFYYTFDEEVVFEYDEKRNTYEITSGYKCVSIREGYEDSDGEDH